MSATGRDPRAPLTHPDPEWWKRCNRVSTPRATDLCEDCGHIRERHGASGCARPSTSIMGAPHPCMCSNRADGSLYRNPATLKDPPREAAA